jgi:outer membrane lipoprotein-sorting protein
MRLPVRSCRAASLAVLASLLASAASPVWSADPPSADQIVKQMQEALEPPKPSVRTMTMTFDDQGKKTTFGLVQARKRLADGDRSLTVLLEPDDARGIAYLMSSASSGEPTEWLYVPYVQRTRKLVPAENYQSFMDTDFTYGDLGLLPTDTKNTLLGTEQLDGKKAYKVESIPGSTVKQWYYSRTVTWIDAETLLPTRREFYSPAGDLFKTETVGAVTRVDGIPTPLQTTITNVGTGTSTTLVVNSVTYDANVPDTLFAPEGLRGVADQDYWKSKPKKASGAN